MGITTTKSPRKKVGKVTPEDCDTYEPDKWQSSSSESELSDESQVTKKKSKTMKERFEDFQLFYKSSSKEDEV
jgi:hypothetical protein